MSARGAIGAALATALLARLFAPNWLPVMLPANWTHEIHADSCHWTAKPWAAALGLEDQPRYLGVAKRMHGACEKARGLKSSSAEIKIVAPRWPTPAELAAWDRQELSEDAYRVALSTPASPLAGDVRSDGPGPS